jgi:hypothetical protein
VTTIAVRDMTMACDSQEGISSDGGGDRAYYKCNKIYPIYDEKDNLLYLIGCSGDSDGAPLFIEWFTEYYDTDLCDKQILKRMFEFDTEALILHDDGTIETGSTFGIIHECNEDFYAIGSGTKCALAAMHCGKTAAESIEISKKIDSHTGGKVQVFTHGQKT